MFAVHGTLPPLDFADPGDLALGFIFAFSVLPFEEFGWRGYALPKLQVRRSALSSSLIVGVFWGLWHAPLFWFQPHRAAGMPILPILAVFVILVSAFSVLHTWLYNSTGGSVLLSNAFHASMGVSVGLFSSQNHDYDVTAMFAFFGLTLAVAAAVILRYGYRDLSRRERVRWKVSSE